MYSVQINPSAWTQLSHLPVETYRRLREELDAVAAQLTDSLAQGVSPAQRVPGGARTLEVEGRRVHYDVDHALRRVLLIEVERTE